LKNFGLVVHKKSQGLVQNRNPKKNMMINLSQQGSKLKKRKETHEASVVEEREPSKKSKQDKTNFFF
jgi:hypothetical protein